MLARIHVVLSAAEDRTLSKLRVATTGLILASYLFTGAVDERQELQPQPKDQC